MNNDGQTPLSHRGLAIPLFVRRKSDPVWRDFPTGNPINRSPYDMNFQDLVDRLNIKKMAKARTFNYGEWDRFLTHGTLPSQHRELGMTQEWLEDFRAYRYGTESAAIANRTGEDVSFNVNALRGSHDTNLNPIVEIDEVDFAPHQFGYIVDYVAHHFATDFKATTLHISLFDSTGKKLPNTFKASVRDIQNTLKGSWLADDVMAIVEPSEDFSIRVVFHVAPLQVDDVALVEDSTAGLMSFLEKDVPATEYVIYGAARGEYGVAIAPPSTYKTTLFLNLSMALATGRPFAPFTVMERESHFVDEPMCQAFAKPRHVVYLDFENSESFAQGDLRKMVKGNGFDREELNLLESNFLPIVDPQVRLNGDADSDMLATLSDIRVVQKLIDRINRKFGEGNCDLIVIDTQAESFDLEDENNNGAQGAGLIVKAVNKFKRETGAHVLLVCHTAKNGEEANQTAERSNRGASRVSDKSRCSWKMTQAKDSGGRAVKGLVEVRNVKTKGPKLFQGDPFIFEHKPMTRQMGYQGVAQPKQPQIPDITEPTEKEAWIEWYKITKSCNHESAQRAWKRRSQ